MPPKTKKTTENTVPVTAPVTVDSLDKLKEEWLSTVKQINDITEQLDVLAKLRDEIVSKIWEHMNKNQTDVTTTEEKHPKDNAKKTDTKSATKKITKSEVVEEEKPAASKKKETVKQEVDEEEKTVAPKKAPAKKTTTKEKEPVKEPVKKVTKKVSAPAKGTPKPQLDDDDDDGAKPLAHESSSETDLDSLSSVSESEASVSGGEDN